MIKTMAFKIDDIDDFSMASALLPVGFIARPFNSIKGFYVVMNELVVHHSLQTPYGRSVTYQNNLYDESKFWERFEQTDPNEDPNTGIFDVRHIQNTQTD